jgi:peptidyl-tRNA hydrolase, PTH2 family
LTTADAATLKLYALIRADLQMPPGKLASQAGHAFLGAFLAAGDTRQADYRATGLGTKICLRAASLPVLLCAFERARALGLPVALIEDTGRNTTFNGVPTLSALGIGPLYSHEAEFLKRYPLHP